MSSALKFGYQPHPDDRERDFLGNYSLAQRQHIGVVMLTGKLGHLLVPAQGTTHSSHFVSDHRLAITRSAKDYAAIAFAFGHGFGRRSDVEWVIDRGIGTKGPEIFYLMPKVSQQDLYFFLEVESGVICSQ